MPITDPKLLEQWDWDKNGALTPCDLTPGSHRKIWWRCEKGHSWQAEVRSRALLGAGCPVCAGKIVVPGVNDLASRFPDIAEQWDVERNGGRTASEAAAFSNQKVWWRCEKGHSWQASISPRSREGYGCPYCSGRRVLKGYNDLATVEPFLAKQWHPTLNGDLTPEQVTAGSRREVWWQCSLGHVWKARVHSRTGKQRSGCPVCAGRTRAANRTRAASRDPPPLATGPPARVLT